MATTIKFRFKSASASVTLFSEDLGTIHSLYSRVRKEGHATELMSHICRWADSKNIALCLSAQGYGGGEIMENKQLIDFYSQFGFHRMIGDGPIWPAFMRREPSQDLQPP